MSCSHHRRATSRHSGVCTRKRTRVDVIAVSLHELANQVHLTQITGRTERNSADAADLCVGFNLLVSSSRGWGIECSTLTLWDRLVSGTLRWVEQLDAGGGAPLGARGQAVEGVGAERQDSLVAVLLRELQVKVKMQVQVQV